MYAPASDSIYLSQTSGLSLRKLQLTAFRCYETARLDLDGRPVVIAGPNGAGKTNILEALSFLTPGRGLRGASLGEVGRTGAAHPWAVAADVVTPDGAVQIGTGLDLDKERRRVRIDGQERRAASDLGNHVAAIWLTPQMDRLFLEGPGARRKFLDRLVFGFEPAHAGRVSRYENALRQRARLLREHGAAADPVWLKSLESVMAETGVAIAAARKILVERLQPLCRHERADFPAAALAVTGWAEDRLENEAALDVEEAMAHALERSRGIDAENGGASVGPQRSDFIVHFAGRNMPAAQCSTGEQKALLITIVLANAQLIQAERGFAPLLLLDEIAAHLDEERRNALFDVLLASGSQFWLTGTETDLFAPLSDAVQVFSVSREHRVF